MCSFCSILTFPDFLIPCYAFGKTSSLCVACSYRCGEVGIFFFKNVSIYVDGEQEIYVTDIVNVLVNGISKKIRE
jgi:hypothetical protein